MSSSILPREKLGRNELSASRPWIIFLAHRVPYPPDKGDRIRTYHVLRYLSARANVLLGCLADEPAPDETRQVLQELCADVCIADNTSSVRWLRGLGSFLSGRTVSEGMFFHPELKRRLEKWRTEHRVQGVLASASSLVSYLDRKGAIPTVVDLIDVDSQKWFDYADVLRGGKRWIYRREGTKLRQVEIDLARTTKALTLVSEAECRLFRSFCQEGRVLSVPNGVDLNYFSPQAVGAVPFSCVFVGAMDYAPNVDAVVWFVEQVWPRIQRDLPQATFEIVGRRPTDAVRKLEQITGVKVAGSVPDVREYVARAAVVVAPLRIARGIQNKVLEALAMGKPVIASPAAMEGLDVAAGTELLRADTPAEWQASLVKMWSDPEWGATLGRAGRAYVERHHAWDECLSEFGRLLELPGPAEKNS